MKNPGWHFPDAPPYEGFNNAAKDHFKGARITSLVREILQNSIDASADSGSPVKVVFSLDYISKSDSAEIVSLEEKINLCIKQSEGLGENHKSELEYFQNAKSLIDLSIQIPVLGIHDYGTTGLTGDAVFDEMSGEIEKSKWFAFIIAQGQSSKESIEAGGSFGHGKNAPFAFSALSTVFYLTEVTHYNQIEQRFIGKSILRSMPKSLGVKEKTQATGFYCASISATYPVPLTGDQIPSWAISIRRSHYEQLGTSIFIPFPNFEDLGESIWGEIKLAVFANFYYSIFLGKLEVELGDGTLISKSNLRSAFESFLPKIEDFQLSGSSETEKLESAKTIHSAIGSQPNFIEIPGIGKVEWFIRVGKDLPNKRVGIARSTGMLITREKQEGLKRISGVQNFDLFIGVLGTEGSALLRKMENPAHDKFSLDRFDSKEQRNSAKAKFEVFIDAIKSLILENAAIHVVEDYFDNALADLLQGENKKDAEGNVREPRNALSVGKIRQVQITATKPKSGSAEEDDGDGGQTGGDGSPEIPGGESSGSTGPGSQIATKISSIEDQRLVALSNNNFLLYFTPSESGRGVLSLYRKGSDLMQKIDFVFNSSRGFEFEIGEIVANKRMQVEISLDPRDLEFSIEPVISLIQEAYDENQ